MSMPRPSPCFAKMASNVVSQRPVSREELEKSGNFAAEGTIPLQLSREWYFKLNPADSP
ncbi:unnamed protein product [Cladocopium goreaui]|uniref:Uncharacterized protein n=1 Tax=Cladocopium goreaui TaxID=2562237 RepID=A0A9P1C6K2_9DINO|nr:unnamed protein product [Cladocopium goreaui]